MGSLLNRIPALLLLQTTLIFLFAREYGLAFTPAILLGELFLAGEILAGENQWDRRKIYFSLILCVLTFFMPFFVSTRLHYQKIAPQKVSGEFIVAERRLWGNGEILRLKDRNGNFWTADVCGGLENAREGERYFLEARAVPFNDREERSSFSSEKFWRSRGVGGQLRNIRGVKHLSDAFSFYTIRQIVRDRISHLPQNCRVLVSAILLGDRDPNLREDFRRWGISHILAVSGWHVGLVAMLGCLIFGPGRLGLILCSILLWGYCFLSGASVSALRASLMLQVGMIGLFTGRKARSLNSIGIAGIIMIVWNPWVAFDLGWQLSVLSAAVVSALMYYKTIAALSLTSPLLWFITSPFVAPLAGGIFYSSLPINAMASVFFSFILGFVLLASLPTLVGVNGFYFSLPAELLLRAWAIVADQWVDWLPRALPVNFFPAWLCGAVFFFLIAGALKLRLLRCVVLAVIGSCAAVIVTML